MPGLVGLRPRIAQFLGAGQVEGAPGAGLGLIAHLLQGVGLQGPGGDIVGLGEDQVVHQLGHPAIVALVISVLRLGQ